MHNRNANGRFAIGNPGGPGRPRKVSEDAYLDVVYREVPEDTWTRIVRRAAADAIRGHTKAREWLTQFLVSQNAIEKSHEPQIVVRTYDQVRAAVMEAIEAEKRRRGMLPSLSADRDGIDPSGTDGDRLE